MQLDAYKKEELSRKPHLKLTTFLLRADGKPTLSGLPNPFTDAEGRPFGYVDELREIGWPACGENGEKIVLENLLVACAPREGGEGSWLYAHHCCASWSDEVVMNKQVCYLSFIILWYSAI